MILDDGVAVVGDCALIGARNLDRAEKEFMARQGLRTSWANSVPSDANPARLRRVLNAAGLS